MKIRDQISVKSPVGFTKKAQPCDLARGHHDFDKVYKGSKFASANIQKILASHQTSNMLRNACAAVRNLKFPKASTDVLLRVILLSDKIDSCFTAEKIRKGFELARYPNVDVRKILEQNLAGWCRTIRKKLSNLFWANLLNLTPRTVNCLTKQL